VSVVWKEDTVVFVRDRVRVERTALGIVGGQNKVVEAVRARAEKALLACSCGFLQSINPPCHGAYARATALPAFDDAGYFIISMLTELKVCSGSAR
jgi:hypothetical protein